MGFQKKKKEEPKPKVEVIAPKNEAERIKALEALSKVLDTKFETTNSLVRLGDRAYEPVPSIVTGFPSLDDYVFGCGGIPRGSVIEIFGPESSGKTTLTLTFSAAEQQQGGMVAYVDAEHALDLTYASVLRVDVGKLFINQPNSGEQALETVNELIKSKAVSLIIVDSVAALVPEAELAGEMGDAHVGLQARMMSQAMRKICGIAKKNLVTVIFINQIREKIGVMFGNPETTTGGRALKFYSTIRIDVRRQSKPIMEGATLVGHNLVLKAVKNKAGVPFRETELSLYYPNGSHEPGLDKFGDTVEYASKIGAIEVAGSWYNFDGERVAQGIENTKLVLANNPSLYKKVLSKMAEVKRAQIDEALKNKKEKI